MLIVFLENVKPSPQSDNVRHSEYRELSIDSTHLTVTFSNLKYYCTGCWSDVYHLIDSLKLRESTTASVTLRPLLGNLGFYLIVIVTAYGIKKHLPFNRQLHNE